MGKKSAWLILIVIIASALYYFLNPQNKNKNLNGAEETEKLKIIFFNVGQGDACLIRTPLGKKILIDGGPDNTVLKKLEQALPWGERKIDLVILTHAHADHVNGLNEIAKRYTLNQVWLNGTAHTSSAYLEFLNSLKKNGTAVKIFFACGDNNGAQCADEISIEPEIVIKALWPKENLAGKRVENLNNSSIVFKLIYKETSFLFMGDAEAEVEKQLVAAYEENVLKSDWLKVSHQGSNDSSGLDFLKKVSAKMAVISVGENNYGHPSARVIKRMERMGTVVLRTDKNGDIVVWSDGRQTKYKDK